jgi:uncharacterized protein (DUF1800 family)
MTISPPRCSPRSFSGLPKFALFLIIFGTVTATRAATAPTLLSASSSTRAIALESVTLTTEPFQPTQSFFGPDSRTRIAIFAMNLPLLAGEGVNAYTANAQDGSGKRYALKVEYAGQVPGFPGITMLIVRLADDMGDLGDVLLNLNLHGLSSNRVRVAIGHIGGGPSDDLGAVPTPAPATPPPADPVLIPDSYTGPATDADTVRFLEQASWGPTAAEVARVKGMGFKAYLNEQFSLPPLDPSKGSNYPDLPFPQDDNSLACPVSNPSDPNYSQSNCLRDNFNMYPIQRTFFTNVLTGQDQLRQRVAFALHQIFVVSGRDISRPSWMTVYLQALDRNAFGNFRTLLNDITLNPGMGEYLDMRLSTRTNPNENFGREILQLLSVGVNELNLDGTPVLDAQGAIKPTYSQANVTEFTRIFTGWNFAPALGAGITNYRDPMVPRGGTTHDVGAKTLFNFTSTANQTAQQDLNTALDNIFNHPNVGPYIGKQLIQHLVTSNPSPAYVERVARVFNNDCTSLYPDSCTNARGNLRAVIQAILLDPEARGDIKTDPNYGKLREPIQLMAGVLRGFDAKSFDKSSTSDGVLAGRSNPDFANQMDQPLFLPATVFSYYQPDYVIPGTKSLGPAFSILSTTTTLRRANFANTMVYTGVAPTTGTNTDRPRGTSLDLAPLQALAPDPNQLLDRLNMLFFHGTMSASIRSSMTTAINGTSASDQLKRAQVAAYLTATSSQYEVQR